MNDQSLKSPLQIWKDLHNVISLPESEGGPLHSSWLEYLQALDSGQDHHLASRLALPVSLSDLTIPDTSRQSLSGSSESANLNIFLESRLRQQLESTGSILYSLTWKIKATPAGRQYCQRAASAPRTSVIDSSLVRSNWPTVTTIDNNQVAGEGAAANHPARGTTLGGAVHLASWPTPTTRDHKDGAECLNVPINSLLGRQVWLTGWATPTTEANTHCYGPQKTIHLKTFGEARLANHADTWPQGTKANLKGFTELRQNQPIRITASGQMLTGSDAGMESSGQLRPGHSRWVMGFPISWDAAAIRALAKPSKKSASQSGQISQHESPGSEGTGTQSCLKWQQSSSKPSLAQNKTSKTKIKSGSFEYDAWLIKSGG